MNTDLAETFRHGLAQASARRAPPEGFPALPPIPGSRYTSAEFMALERERLWRRAWLYACHTDQLTETGSYLRWEKTGAPIVIVRGEADEIRAFYNVCRHRGGPLVQEPAGTLKNGFVCAFHGWGYGLDGRLRGVRDRADFVGLDFECMGLTQVRCERLGNWIFINEDGDAPPLAEALWPVAGHLETWGVLETRHVDSRAFDVKCNFKLMLENFFEVYHLGAVHADTVDRFLDHRGSHHVLWAGGHSLMLTPHRDPDWVDPGTRGLPEFPGVHPMLGTNNASYNLFPNLVTPVAPTGLPFLVCWPTGVDSVRLESHWFAPSGTEPLDEVWQKRIENFDRILGEDRAIVEHQQLAASSSAFDGTRVGYQERRIYHWHEELDRRIGAGRIPDKLRVEPMLMVEA